MTLEEIGEAIDIALELDIHKAAEIEGFNTGDVLQQMASLSDIWGIETEKDLTLVASGFVLGARVKTIDQNRKLEGHLGD